MKMVGTIQIISQASLKGMGHLFERLVLGRLKADQGLPLLPVLFLYDVSFHSIVIRSFNHQFYMLSYYCSITLR